MRSVCVLGGSLSGLECARLLAAAGLEVHIFRRLHDPSRSLFDLHPIYEYTPRAIPVPPSAEELRASAERWARLGLVQDDSSRVGRIRTGQAFRPGSPTHRVCSVDGGFFGLLDALAEGMEGDAFDRQEIVAEIAPAPARGWTATDIEGASLGAFDSVVCCYDYFLRGTRKAAVRCLLEAALPAAAPVMRSVAGAVDCCAFALVAAVPGAERVPFDAALVEGVPEVALAVRNPAAGHAARGLPGHETWTLVATPQWTDEVRPNAKTWWDKGKTSQAMLSAFARLAGCKPGRGLRPPYHWGGFTCLTASQSHGFAFDADASLGFVGDFFHGHGADEALRSGAALARHMLSGAAASALPAPDDWAPRGRPSTDAEDTAALFGRPAGTEDHSWPTAAQLSARGGLLPKGACAMDRYRRRGLRGRPPAGEGCLQV